MLAFKILPILFVVHCAISLTHADLSLMPALDYIPVEKISTAVFNNSLNLLSQETQSDLLKLLLKFEEQEKKKHEFKQKLIQQREKLLKQKLAREQDIYQKHLMSRVRGSILKDLLTLRY